MVNLIIIIIHLVFTFKDKNNFLRENGLTLERALLNKKLL